MSKNVTFDENDIEHKEKEQKEKLVELNNYEEENTGITENEANMESVENEENNEIHEDDEKEKLSKSGRKISVPKHPNEYGLYTAHCLYTQGNDLKNYQEAMNIDDGWKETIHNEIKAHKKMKTW